MDFAPCNSRILCFFMLFSFLIEAQVLIPAKQDGFWFGSKPDAADSILIEAFFDPVCPDSRDSWPPLKQALHHYGPSDVRLVLYTFPLPYHDNAFITSRALYIANKLNASATYVLLEEFFKLQKRFYGKTTFNETRATVEEHVVNVMANVLGSSYEHSIRSGFLNSKTNQATRISFKHGCLRGVFGTPFFFVNGFPLPDSGSALDFKGWKRILDPLINKSRQGDSVHSLW